MLLKGSRKGQPSTFKPSLSVNLRTRLPPISADELGKAQ